MAVVVRIILSRYHTTLVKPEVILGNASTTLITAFFIMFTFVVLRIEPRLCAH
jgi:hypothetical protein